MIATMTASLFKLFSESEVVKVYDDNNEKIITIIIFNCMMCKPWLYVQPINY